MRCERCPAGWETGGMTDCGYECESYGCLILGEGITDAFCKLSKKEIEKRLAELKEYEAGRIERPQWVANRFIREMDAHSVTGSFSVFLPGFPPLIMRDGCYSSLHSSMSISDTYKMAYREGYEDAKEGKEMREEP